MLIKENHAALAGGITQAVRRANSQHLQRPLEVECRTLEEVDEALAAGAPRILLDNMDFGQLRDAVGHVDGRAELEASGGVTLQTLKEIASTGVQFISVGALTHSAPALDLSLILTPRHRHEPADARCHRRTSDAREHSRSCRRRSGRSPPSGAVILAHNYQLPEIQDVADFVGDSLGLSQRAAAADAETIVFCGVHFMAETASILCPDKQVLIPDLDAGCSLADSITAEQLREWKAKHPGALVVMYVNTTAEVKAQTDYCCTSANAVKVVEHILPRARPGHRDPVRPGYVPRGIRREDARPADARLGWRVPCACGIRPADITAVRSAHPEADFLIHPECGCSTSVMEYVAAGDVDAEGVHMLSTGRDAGLRARAPVRHRDRRDRDGDASPPAPGRARHSSSSPPTRPPTAAT